MEQLGLWGVSILRVFLSWGVMVGVSKVWAGSANQNVVLTPMRSPHGPPSRHSPDAEPQMAPLLIPPPLMNCNNNPITLRSPIG